MTEVYLGGKQGLMPAGHEIRWAGYTHEEIYTRVWAGPGPTGSAEAQDVWASVERRLREIDADLAAETARIRDGWEGTAADTTHEVLTPLGSWVADAAGDALLTATGLVGQAEQVDWVRRTLEPPVEDDPVERPAWGPADPELLRDLQTADALRSKRYARAVDLMLTYTLNSSANARSMSYWSPPPSVAVTPDVTIVPAGVGGGWSPPGGAGGYPSIAAGDGTGLVAAGTGPTGSGLGVPGGAAGTDVAGAGGAGTGGAAGSGPGGVGPNGIAGPSPAGGTLPGSSSTAPGIAGGPVPPVPPNGSGISRPPGSSAGTVAPASVLPSKPGSPRFQPVVPAVPEYGPTPGTWRDQLAVGADPGRGVTPGVPARPIAEPWARPPATEPGAPARGTGSAGGTAAPAAGGRGMGQHGFMPMGAGAGAGQEREHPRPGYLIDDSDAFADDRWFTPPVIGGDDPPP